MEVGSLARVEAKDDKRNLKWRILEESKKTWSIAFPTMLTRLGSYGLMVITQAFIGHIGKLELAAYALVQIISVRFVSGIVLGMSSATETLCGQAYGATQYHMLGIYLQRSWIINVITVTALAPCFIFATPIFRLVHQEEDITIMAGIISLWFIPLLYSTIFTVTIQQYLQAQQKNMFVGCLSIATLPLHMLLSWAFVYKMGMGIPGAMGALIISSYFVVTGEFLYVFGGWCPNTWQGFTREAFKDMFPIVKLSISSGIMLCLEFWYRGILVLLAGYTKNATISMSAFSICLNIMAWEYMIHLGFQGTACVRVSNELGRGCSEAAKFSIKVILSTSTCIGVFFSILCLVLGHNIAYLFTSNEEIAKSMSSLFFLVAISIILQSVQPVLSGVAVGASWQGVMAFVNLGCYYFIGIPIGVLLSYVAHLQVKGIWIGMTCGVAAQTLVLIYITWRTDWDVQVNKAADRMNKWCLKPTNEIDQNLTHV